MNKIKKALLLALSLAMSATLFAACGGGDNENTSSAGGASGSVESSVEVGGGSSVEIGGGSSEVVSSGATSEEIGGGSTSEIVSSGATSEEIGGGTSEEIGGGSSEVVSSGATSEEIGGDSSEESSGGENVGEEGSSDIEIDWNAPLGGDIIGEQVSKAEFEQALESTVASQNFIVKGYMRALSGAKDMAAGYTQVADGKIYNYTTTTFWDNGVDMTQSFSLYVGAVDGVEYLWYSEDGSPYEMGYAKDEELDGCCNGNLFLMYFAYADYDVATYDATTGAYVVEITEDGYTQTFSLKIVDGKVVAFCISTVTGDMEQTFVIEYGNAYVGELPPVSEIGGGSIGGDKVEVNLPEANFDFDTTLGDDIIGEEVTAEEMQKAIEATCASNNFTIKGHSFIEGGASLIIGNVANEKSYNVTRATYPTQDGTMETMTLHMILGAVDSVDYAWMSFDCESWDCALADEVVMGGGTNGNEVFGMYLQLFMMMDSEFNAQTGEYSITADGTTMAIKIVDGVVKMIDMTSEDMYITYVVEYGNAVDFTLPPVTVNGGENGGDVTIPEIETPISDEVNAEAWAVAIADLSATINFTANGIGSIEFLDGSGLSAEASLYTQIADGKGYAVIISSGMEEYSYVGNVDGKNYEWYSYDGKTWECECMGDAFAIDGAYFLSEMIPKEMTFDTVVYDKDEGGYKYTISETDYVVIGINDGKVSFVKSVETVDNGDWYSRDTYIYVLTYGNANVGDLPPVENVGSGEEVNGGNGEMSETAGVEKEEEILKQ